MATFEQPGFSIAPGSFFDLEPGVRYTVYGGGNGNNATGFRLRKSGRIFQVELQFDSIEVDGNTIDRVLNLGGTNPTIAPGIKDLNLTVMYRLYNFLGEQAYATPVSVAAGTAFGNLAGATIVGPEYEPWECFYTLAWGSAPLTTGDIVAAVGLNGGPYFAHAVGPGSRAHGKISVPAGFSVWVAAGNSDTSAHNLYYSIADHHP